MNLDLDPARFACVRGCGVSIAMNSAVALAAGRPGGWARELWTRQSETEGQEHDVVWRAILWTRLLVAGCSVSACSGVGGAQS